MPTRPPRHPSGYLDAGTLAVLVADFRRQRIVSDALARALLAIAAGVWQRYRFLPDQDEFTQEVIIHLLGRPLRKCDPRQPCFNFFTKCAVRFGLKLRDKAAGERRRFHAFATDYAEELRLGGGDLPTHTARFLS